MIRFWIRANYIYIYIKWRDAMQKKNNMLTAVQRDYLFGYHYSLYPRRLLRRVT